MSILEQLRTYFREHPATGIAIVLAIVAVAVAQFGDRTLTQAVADVIKFIALAMILGEAIVAAANRIARGQPPDAVTPLNVIDDPPTKE